MTTQQPSPGTKSPSSSKSLPQNVRLLGWASLLNDIASEAIYPFLPQFLLGLGGSRTLLGLLEGLADTVSSLLKLWTGAWSDRLGQRKIFVVMGYAFAGLSRPCLGFATQISHVFGIRLLDRIGKGIRTAPRDALITESTVESQRGLGSLRKFGMCGCYSSHTRRSTHSQNRQRKSLWRGSLPKGKQGQRSVGFTQYSASRTCPQA